MEKPALERRERDTEILENDLVCKRHVFYVNGGTEAFQFDEFSDLLDLLTDTTTTKRSEADLRIHRIHSKTLFKVVESSLEVSRVKVGASTSIETEDQQT